MFKLSETQLFHLIDAVDQAIQNDGDHSTRYELIKIKRILEQDIPKIHICPNKWQDELNKRMKK